MGRAEDKWESVGLVGIKSEDIEAQIEYYMKNIPDDLRNDPIGLEKFIQKMQDSESPTRPAQGEEWVGPHMLMSYLAWKAACDSKLKSYAKKVTDTITLERK